MLTRDSQLSQPGRSGASSPVNGLPRRGTRSRSGTNGSLAERFGRIAEDEPLEPPSRPAISSRLPSGPNSPRRELPGFDLPVRPVNGRSNSGFEGPTSLGHGRDGSPVGMPRLSRLPTEPTQLLAGRSNLRITKNREPSNVFGDENDSETSESPSDYQHSRATSWSVQGMDAASTGRKAPPPPPPPSRAKKPPPPPPMKRSALSTSEIPRY